MLITLKNANTIAGDDIPLKFSISAPESASLIGAGLSLLIESITGENLATYTSQSGAITKVTETANTIVAAVTIPASLTANFGRDRICNYLLRVTLTNGTVFTPDAGFGQFKVYANPAL